ncbi:MAG: 4Fe-4S binding protein [Candidatus Bathyarchaeia archaeon]
MKSTKNIIINEELCKGCSICIKLCPMKVLDRSNDLSPKGVYLPVVIQEDKCTGCRICEEHCPDMAIFIVNNNGGKN